MDLPIAVNRTLDLHQADEVSGLRAKSEEAVYDALEKLAAMKRGRELFGDGLATLRIDSARVLPTADVSDTDLYIEALLDRMS